MSKIKLSLSNFEYEYGNLFKNLNINLLLITIGFCVNTTDNIELSMEKG